MNWFLFVGIASLGFGLYAVLKYVVDALYEKVQYMQGSTAFFGILAIVFGLAALLTGLSYT